MTDKIRLGMLRLTDAAPLVVADEQQIFKGHGLNVEVSVEPSWANIADKLGYGLLEGAVMLPPLALACVVGARGRKTDLVVPMSLSANGNTVTLARKWQEVFAAGGIKALSGRQKLRLAVVHRFSTHDLLLRYWLAANGVNPEQDAEIMTLSPSEMVGSLAAGAIDGFCVGAPWGHVASGSGLGFTALTTDAIWENHPEKCLALRSDFVAGDPAQVRVLLAALRDACAYCAMPSRRAGLAKMLSKPAYLDLPAEMIANSLAPEEGGSEFHLNYPVPAHANWFAMQMLRWGKVKEDVLGAAGTLYRPDIFLASGGKRPLESEEVFCDSPKR
jgi:NitT/TauT family transport system ATP-binding protein/nitrate/nitrite transport system substrate-binding protein